MQEGLLQCRGHLLQVQHVAEVSELLLPQGPRARAVKAVKELLEASFILVLLSFIHPIACHAHLQEEMGQVTMGGMGQQKTPRAATAAAHQAVRGCIYMNAPPLLQPLPSHCGKKSQSRKTQGKKPAEPNPQEGTAQVAHPCPCVSPHADSCHGSAAAAEVLQGKIVPPSSNEPQVLQVRLW